MNQKDRFSLYDHFILNEVAYFYKKGRKKIDKVYIDKLFEKVLGNIKGKDVFTVVKCREEKINESVSALSSLLIYKSASQPLCFNFEKNSFPTQLKEEKISYLLIVEIGKYIVIFKKNIARLSSFINDLKPIDSKYLSGILVNKDTAFQKLKLTNMNMNEEAVRNKMYEANHLEHSMPLFCADQSIVNGMRITNGKDVFSVNINTSNIAKFGIKRNIHRLLIWIADIVNKLCSYNPDSSFLSNFAAPVRWSDKGQELKPVSILINLFDLYNYINTNLTDHTIYRKINKDQYKNSNIVYKWFSRKGSVCFNLDENFNKKVVKYVSHELKNNLFVRKNKQGIKLYLENNLASFYCKNNDELIPLVNIINTMFYFSIGFEDYSYIYYSRQLYQNKKILEQKDSILNVFEEHESLKSIVSEKGKLSKNSRSFSQDSIFYFVEELFKDAEILVCDDLGNEWADHIALNGNSISFIHSKCKDDTSLSASNFQEVVGQAIKNIGHFFPDDETLQNKGKKFLEFVGNTHITRYRKRKGADFVTKFKKISANPNAIREVVNTKIFVQLFSLASSIKFHITSCA